MKLSLTLKQIFAAILVFSSIVPVSCSTTNGISKGEHATRTFVITKKFTGIKSTTIFDISYTGGSSESKAIVVGPKEIVEKLDWKIESNGMLSFYYPGNIKNAKSRIRISLTGPDLSDYSSTSSGTIKVLTPVGMEKRINVDSSSAGSIIFDKDVMTKVNINIDTSSAGKIIINGALNVNVVNADASSSSTIMLGQVMAHVINTTASSTGMVKVNNGKCSVSNSTVSSGGEVAIAKLETSVVNVDASSAGEVILSECTTGNFNVECSSGGFVTASGETFNGNFIISSASTVNVKNMKIKNLRSLDISSGGSFLR